MTIAIRPSTRPSNALCQSKTRLGLPECYEVSVLLEAEANNGGRASEFYSRTNVRYRKKLGGKVRGQGLTIDAMRGATVSGSLWRRGLLERATVGLAFTLAPAGRKVLEELRGSWGKQLTFAKMMRGGKR